MEHHLLMTLVLIACLGVAAQWLAWRIKVPAIIMLILFGFLVGPVAGWLEPAETLGHILHPFIALFVAIILFEGGLNLRLHEYRETGIDVKRLVVLGLPLTWILSSCAAHYVAGLSWPTSMVLGAITVVTGPTVILPLLKQVKLKRRPAALLKWEGIINDPVGALLTVLIVEFFISTVEKPFATGVILTLGMALLVATVMGGLAGFLLGWLFRHGHVPEFLKSPVMLASVLGLYALVNQVQTEAGLMAVTVAGVVLTNQKLPAIEELRRFKEYITIFLVSCLFIILTANIELSTFLNFQWEFIAWLAAVIFLIRPVSVYLATIGTGIDWRERLLVGWIAPRGIVAVAVAGLFSPKLVEHGYDDAVHLLPLVFCLIVGTVVLHGLSITWCARRLKLAAPKSDGLLIVGASPWTIEFARVLQALKIPTIVTDSSWNHLHSARMSGIQTHHGDILSEHAEENLDMHEINCLLAATPNPASNSLVCTRFAHELDSRQIYQLNDMDKQSKKVSYTVRGKIALYPAQSYEELIRHHYAGWKFHKTPLTNDYTFDQFKRDTDEKTILVALVNSKKAICLFPLPEGKKTIAGDTIISYQPN